MTIRLLKSTTIKALLDQHPYLWSTFIDIGSNAPAARRKPSMTSPMSPGSMAWMNSN